MDFVEIWKRRQKKRSEEKTYKVLEDSDKERFYILDMFPYPSWAGLHVWHPKWYIATDVIARKHMLMWKKVLHPMGFDTFWLWTEQYAIDNKMRPQDAAAQNIDTYKKQLWMFGCTYDWDREVNTADPKYFKWTQQTFLKLYNSYFDDKTQKAKPISELREKLKLSNILLQWEGTVDEKLEKYLNTQRLAYVDYKPINRCPSCKTWLANEDLNSDGTCERCGTKVEQKPMRQWVIRITKYAERLLEWLNQLDWRDDSVKDQQRNWIGKSVWTQFEMKIPHIDPLLWGDGEGYSIEVYTTRIDTVFGMSFVAIAPEHPLVNKITTEDKLKEVQKYQEDAKHKTSLQRTELEKDKSGVFCGAYAINPFNNKKVPIFVADYVLAGYGTGVVMAVPAHDERDFEFAKKYNLEIKNSILPIDRSFQRYEEIKSWDLCYTEKWVLNDSGDFSGLRSDDAIEKMQEWLEKEWIWWKKINYRLQDRVFSRQRYRWEPIPMIHCEKCGIVAMKENEMPLELPDVENYEPTGTEEGPLANIDDWMNVKCPKCGWDARRESNTMPGWAGSSRYWIRYMDPSNENELVSPEKEKFWDPVDVYVWWAEHITRHMIYARFWHKFLQDMGTVSVDEPFKKYQHVWLIMAEDGRKMSKRRWNVINPDDIINEFGSDTLRVYEMFMWPFDQAVAWNTNGVKWVKKFLDRVVDLYDKIDETYTDDKKILNILHQTIKKVTEDIDRFGFNTAISQMMILVNELTWVEKISKDSFEKLILILAPFAPHLSEEFAEKLWLKSSIFNQDLWPSYDEKYLVQDTINMAIQFNGKVRWTVEISPKASQDDVMNLIKSDEKIAKYLEWNIVKIIYIPGKICNIVVK